MNESVVLTATRRGRGSAPERCACPGCGARPSTLCTLKHRGLNSPSRGLKQSKSGNKAYIHNAVCVVRVCMYACRYSLLESQSAQLWCVCVCMRVDTVRITVSTDVVALDLSYRGTGCRVDTRVTTVLQTNKHADVKPYFMARTF